MRRTNLPYYALENTQRHHYNTCLAYSICVLQNHHLRVFDIIEVSISAASEATDNTKHIMPRHSVNFRGIVLICLLVVQAQLRDNFTNFPYIPHKKVHVIWDEYLRIANGNVKTQEVVVVMNNIITIYFT